MSEDAPVNTGAVAWPDDFTASVMVRRMQAKLMHFASPLFHGLGYHREQEAAGFGIRLYQGGRAQHIEADLIYFADELHDLDKGQPLVLVECKRPGRPLDPAAGQVRSYALWVRPAYYVITNAESVGVWDYQGAIAPDRKVLEVKQAELADSFDDLYAHLNPAAASATRQKKIARLTAPR
jgi:Type I restriction enzyme R protein N terminus (HSDR_N)